MCYFHLLFFFVLPLVCSSKLCEGVKDVCHDYLKFVNIYKNYNSRVCFINYKDSVNNPML